MGLPKKCYISLWFDTVAPVEFQTPDDLEKALKEFYKSKNPEYKGEPHICIHDFDGGDEYAEFEMYSDRCQNLDFQVELLDQYLDELYPNIVNDYTKDSWEQAEYP